LGFSFCGAKYNVDFVQTLLAHLPKPKPLPFFMAAQNPNTRLETFCDGVIAIAITLLVLEIKVPPVDSIHSSEELVHTLLHHWPSWFAFILSFGTILIAWVNHHSIFKYVDKTSNLFVYANGLFLLSIATLPFPTALMAEYINTDYAKNAIIVYCLFSVFNSIAWVLLLQSTLSPKSLAKNPAAYAKLVTGRNQCIYGFVVYSINAVVAFWFPFVALTILSILWVVWLVVGIVLGNKVEVE